MNNRKTPKCLECKCQKQRSEWVKRVMTIMEGLQYGRPISSLIRGHSGSRGVNTVFSKQLEQSKVRGEIND
jgi:hypothetical protein